VRIPPFPAPKPARSDNTRAGNDMRMPKSKGFLKGEGQQKIHERI